ncbi:MAG: hypothetical protein CO095_13730, partial [Armatimonadetes bacterium CG_4_9_14_3_um_filter_58_7]
DGFLLLAACNGPLPPSLAFVRAFARLYLTSLCHAPKEEETLFPEVPTPKASELEAWLETAPPFRGMENFDAIRAE